MFDAKTDPLSAFHGRRVTVMGLGLFGGGRGATEFLCRHHAEVTVTDLRSEEELAPALKDLRDLPVRWVLGRHREKDFLSADLVVVSPAVPRGVELVSLCRKRGVSLETEMNLFFKYCRGRICAVTGSNGKSTTTTLLASMLGEVWPATRVGGNLGKSLLPEVESIVPGEWVVLELSSFQLEDLGSLMRRPEISVVTNLSPNHLDRHGTYESYRAAKRVILEDGPEPNSAVLNGEDPLARSWANCNREVVFFGRTASVLPKARGVWVDTARQTVWLTGDGGARRLFALPDLRLKGTFNALNAAAAAAAALLAGAGQDAVSSAVSRFRAVEHRLEPVAESDGISYVNDSVATTPESTIAALEALGPRVLLICGGSDKGCSFGALGRAIVRQARTVILMGSTADAIRAAVTPHVGAPTTKRASSLEEAVRIARDHARPGDTVLLSPACPSYDQFAHFVERGRRFKDLVRAGLGNASQRPPSPPSGR